MSSHTNKYFAPSASAAKFISRSLNTDGPISLIGSFLVAAGMVMFLQPNQIAGGGTPGLAILVCHVSGLSAGSAMILLNLPLLLLGGHFLGGKFAWRTILSVLLISGLVDLLREVLQVSAATKIPLLASISGGVLIGIGVGLILKAGASAGGPTIIARIVAARSGIPPGSLILLMDCVIVSLSAIVFGALEPALLSMLSVFVTGRCIDLTLNGQAMKVAKTTGLGIQRRCRSLLSFVGSGYQAIGKGSRAGN